MKAVRAGIYKTYQPRLVITAKRDFIGSLLALFYLLPVNPASDGLLAQKLPVLFGFALKREKFN